jgi:hypothetical protein
MLPDADPAPMNILTMCDLRFLPQTLTLYRSLLRHAEHFSLNVLCMDAQSERFLRRRGLAHVDILQLGNLEAAEPEFAATRSRRSWREYCWTATPALCHHVLSSSSPGTTIAWVDADVEFVCDPRALLGELRDGSVLLIPHEYRRAYPAASPAARLTRLYGRFNGGTVVFRHDPQGLEASRLWLARSIAWCHERCEPSRFGNQLHLDDFPERFSGAQKLRVPGGVLGPWNGGGFRVRRHRDGPRADDRPVIAYHYESLRLRRTGPFVRVPTPNAFSLSGTPEPLEARVQPHYRLSRSERRIFWRPHVQRLSKAVREVLESEPEFERTLLPAASSGARLEALRTHLNLQASRILLPSGTSVRLVKKRPATGR